MYPKVKPKTSSGEYFLLTKYDDVFKKQVVEAYQKGEEPNNCVLLNPSKIL
ncbi:hypothetical protein ACNPYQ_002123 [Listeria monocytogenes]|nr:hypothetical protein [Listeria monocytogenes]